MKVSRTFVGVALLALGAVACKNTDFKKTKDGFPYKIISEGKGDTISAGSFVRFHQTDRLGDSLVGTTYGGAARWLPIPKEGAQDIQLVTLMLQARKGDSILLITPVDSIIAKNPRAASDSFLMANKGKQIQTGFRIVDVFKDEASARAEFDKENRENYFKDPQLSQQRSKDVAELENYFKANNIQPKKTEWGTYVQTLTPGNGQTAKTGQFVMLRYTGKLLNGDVFDSNNKPGAPLLPVQSGAGGTIVGFEDGVKQLSKGEKAMLYIPSVIGYGAQGMPPKIGPNQNLVFEIEVVDISDTPPAPPSMPSVDSTRR